MGDSQLTLAQQLAVCQQVARLVRAKLPISGELARLADDASHPMVASARAVDQRLTAGQSLAQALASDDSRNSRILAACIEIGEQSGHLDQALEYWTAMHLASSRCAKSLRAAMVYPTLLIAITLLSLGYVIWQVIPEYRATYALFSSDLPSWLELLVAFRDQLGLLMLGMLLIILAPIVVWRQRRTGVDRFGLPRQPADRLRFQALATELAAMGISSQMPLKQLIELSVLASGGSRSAADESFELIQQQRRVPQLALETSLLFASLHAGIVSAQEAVHNLTCVAQHLRQHADLLAERTVRWLPMLVALSVGFLTVLAYVFLIYLPWILLLQRMLQTDST
jgi:type II secretory pathway component PulF